MTPPTPQTLALWNAQAAIRVAELNKKYADKPQLTFKPVKWEHASAHDQELTRRCAKVMALETTAKNAAISQVGLLNSDLSTLRLQLDALKAEVVGMRTALNDTQKLFEGGELSEMTCSCFSHPDQSCQWCRLVNPVWEKIKSLTPAKEAGR